MYMNRTNCKGARICTLFVTSYRPFWNFNVDFLLALWQCPMVTALVQKCGSLILRTCAVFRNVHL